MNEIKIANEIQQELDEIVKYIEQFAGEFEQIESPEIKTLATANKYIAQQKQIKELVNLYLQLLVKDVSNVKIAMSEFENKDSEIADANRN